MLLNLFAEIRLEQLNNTLNHGEDRFCLASQHCREEHGNHLLFNAATCLFDRLLPLGFWQRKQEVGKWLGPGHTRRRVGLRALG